MNEEIKDLFAAGADIVQIDEPYLQAAPEKARRYAIPAISAPWRACEELPRCTHASDMRALVNGRPAGYSFLEELMRNPGAAGLHRDGAVRAGLLGACGFEGKKMIVGVLDLSTQKVETPETVAARIRRALPFVSAERIVIAPDCGLKYMPRDVAFGKMRVDGRGRGPGSRGM